MEIARAAAALFVRQGLRATRAEDIAQAAGIAPRTFYRYFATKEEAVAPLYAAGAQRWAEAVRSAPDRLSVPEALEHAVHHTFTPGAGVSVASWEWVRTLIRLADSSPALRKVWAEVCQASEQTLAEILAHRIASSGRRGTGVGSAGSGDDAGSGEAAAGSGDDAGSGEAAAGSGDDPGSGEADAVEGRRDTTAPGPTAPAQVTPGLRFAAAVAGTAVRVAVESWATSSSPPSGPEGPAALALRNLRSLRDFQWGEG
nr:TetR family transcriptional regulator [Streptomyces puniciscabiei]